MKDPVLADDTTPPQDPPKDPPSSGGAPKEPTDIRPITIGEEMKRSFLDYAMSVIVSRALPDVRDGLEAGPPAHSATAPTNSACDWNKKYVKSARIVGEVMGKYHPHGDLAIYDAMVRMAQEWSLGAAVDRRSGQFRLHRRR